MRRTTRLVATSAALTIAALAAGSSAPALSAAPARPAAPGGPGLAAASVTRVSVVPSNGRAEVVIGVDSEVTFRDFTLAGPHRVVVDVNGARLGSALRFYDRVARGGITNLRVAQYKADVVRIVIELDSLRGYEVTREGDALRVSVAGAASEFAAWHSGPAAGAAAAAARPEVVREAAPEVVREAAPAAEALPTAARVEARVETRRPMSGATPVAQSQQPRITVTYQDADIRDVLAAFAAFSGRTIVVGPQVTGTVTAEIRDQPWDVALRAILQAQGLSATEDPSGIITVDTYRNIASRQASEPLETRLIALNYARASSLQETVRQLLSRDCPPGADPAAGGQGGGGGGGQCAPRGAVAVDTATNTLLVTEVPSRMGDLLGYVQALDIRTPQVAIKAKIIFVSRTDIEELGVTYDLGSTNGFSNRLLQRTNPTTGQPFDPATQVVQLGGDALVGLANANRRFQSTAAINLLYSTAIGNYTLTSFIDALQEIRLADTQAEPNIVTLDNRAASILVGEETPVRIIDAGSGAGQLARATVNFKESGIRLDVTPHITNNRQIMMTLHAEQSQLQAAAADIGFTFLKRRADSQVLVGDGETAVFGGLTLTQVTTSKSGIPFLVDLPLIGRLFGETRSSETKQDMLVLVTPHIIDDGETVRPPGGTR